jgi:hypothetical protein
MADDHEPPARGTRIGVYIAGVGMALAFTFVDGMVNRNTSAMQKFANFGAELFQDPQSLQFYAKLAFAFFGLAAALLIFVNLPLTKKDAAAYGAGVLAFLNVGVPPQGVEASRSMIFPLVSEALPESIDPAAAPLRPYHGTSSLNFLGTAHAQTPTANSRESSEPRTIVWIFIAGIMNFSQPNTRYFVKNEENKLVGAVLAKSAAMFVLAQGNYYVQVQHPGYRSMIFPIKVEGQYTGIVVNAEKVRFDNIENAFGPTAVASKPEDGWAIAMNQASNKCREGDPLSAAATLEEVPALFAELNQSGILKPEVCRSIFAY